MSPETNGAPLCPADVKQTMYPIVTIAVQPTEDGGRVLLVDTPADGQLLFPMTADAAASVGHALAAPSVIVPGQEPNRAQRREEARR